MMNVANSFEEFNAILRKHEIDNVQKYIITKHGPKTFSSLKIELSRGLRLHWEDDVPYFHFGTRIYGCHHGKDHNTSKKRQYALKREEEAQQDHCFVKRERKIQVTKKLDCPALVRVTRAYRMPNHKVSGQITKSKKETISAFIKKEIAEGKDLGGKDCYVFNLPCTAEHKYHLFDNFAAVTESVDTSVRNYISKLVREGKRNPHVISELVEIYAEKELLQLDKSRRRFYPDIQAIRKIITQVKRSIRHSKIDQINVATLIKTWKNDCQVFFRPFIVETMSEDEDNSGINFPKCQANAGKNHLLFLYQSKEMGHLYRRYGNSAILLDATYRTCKYALPVYFIVVRTNVNYQVVCVFITQFENSASLTEALHIFKSWNPDVHPKYAMVDFVYEEITSLQNTFQDIQIFICSFHREQAWSRWISLKKNSELPRDEALGKLRSIANAGTVPEMLESIDDLKSWDFYSTTPIKKYFENTWEPEIKRWAVAYKPIDMLLNTNNGVERLNEELKYRHLTEYKNCMLSEMIQVLVNSFLPERYQMYVKKNLLMSPLHQKYHKDIPTYLHGRPKWLINHIYQRSTHFSQCQCEAVSELTNDTFQVPAETNDAFYIVTFNKENKSCHCTCRDFSSKRLICKHMLMVGVKYPLWKLEQISSWLLVDPIFNSDDIVTQISGQQQLSDINQHQQEIPNINVGETDILEASTSMGKDASTGKVQMSNLGDLKFRSNKRQILNDCNATIRSIQSVMWNLNEQNLKLLSDSLRNTFTLISAQVESDSFTGLPIAQDASKKQNNKRKTTNILEEMQEKDFQVSGKLPLHPSKKVKRFGAYADSMKQATNINVQNEV